MSDGTGAAAARRRAVPLAAGEHALLQGVVRLRISWRLPRPVLLRLTPPRLVTLVHYAFAPDRVLELGHIVEIVCRRAANVAVTLRLGPWIRPNKINHPIRDAGRLAEQLNKWLSAS